MKQILTINYSYASLITDIKKLLSVIGKRTKTNDGQDLFSQVTLSSVEEPVLNGYIHSANEKITNLFREFITDTTSTITTFSFTFENTRWRRDSDKTSPLLNGLSSGVKGFIVSFAVSEILAPNFPQLAEKFANDAKMHLDSLSKLIYYKMAPEQSTSDYSSISGSVTTK